MRLELRFSDGEASWVTAELFKLKREVIEIALFFPFSTQES
jgi:hypothetical protein